ncbi:glycoside hydrolase family 108 protein [Jeongeupia naejangsanensis]|uniref:Uncharacterized protein n=1 Tax=Jeongeupia naejangsanensis TaxID=613195 RepID=A0ABS2BFB1_9NEIS|nr:glycosyl hydrolase 108 family protein [Jeongeupia naejangsanensis]MBM3114296.1 hypothetical protein [Jeongeupia naejangsanensis]
MQTEQILSHRTNLAGQMLNFAVAFQRTIGLEGDYWDDPAGGPTRYGITETTARDHGYCGDMHDLPLTTAAAIYWQSYWVQSGCVYFPLVLAYQLFDAGVNHGPATAIKLLQRAVGTDDDGIIGSQTLDATKAMNPYDVAILFLAQRERYFTDCTGWPDNGKGWSRRVVQNLQYAQQDAVHREG